MAMYETFYRYWKITHNDLYEALKPQYSGISIHIDGSGANWEDKTGTVTIPKGSDGWSELERISKLDCFVNKNEHTNSKRVSDALQDYFK